VALYLARGLTGMGGKELGEIFGKVSGAAITMRHKAVSEKIRKNKRLKGRINRLAKQIINI
jgi:chromosomal replication initiation ATPase DnaA